MLLKELFLREDDRSTAVFAFGRFNPPTIGHQKLIETVLQTAEKVNGKAYLFLSHKQNNKTDPLSLSITRIFVEINSKLDKNEQIDKLLNKFNYLINHQINLNLNKN